MKINGTGSIGGTAAASRKRPARAGGADFRDALSGDAVSGSTPLVSAAPLAAVNGLFLLQEAPDAAAGRSRGVARAENMLAELEEVKRGLVLGAIPVARLQSLADTARRQKQATGDARLNDLLDQIELRAEVELAKLGY